MLSLEQIKSLYPRAAAEHLAAFEAQEDGLLRGYGMARKPIRLQDLLSRQCQTSSNWKPMPTLQQQSPYRLLPTHQQFHVCALSE